MSSREIEKLKREYYKLDKQTDKIVREQDISKSEIRHRNTARMEEIKSILKNKYGEDIEPCFDLAHQIDWFFIYGGMIVYVWNSKNRN